jgi:phenylpyruvate tautomerase
VISIHDKADVIFAGSDEPAALGMLCSIGSIDKVTNGKITAAVSDLLEGFGVKESRIYINFFDMEPANMGWSRATFAEYF